MKNDLQYSDVTKISNDAKMYVRKKINNFQTTKTTDNAKM